MLIERAIRASQLNALGVAVEPAQPDLRTILSGISSAGVAKNSLLSSDLPVAWLLQSRLLMKTTVSISFLFALIACGAQPSVEPPVAPATRMDARALASTRGQATSLIGTWHGAVHFEQSIGGQTKSVSTESELEFGSDALPARLAGLGFTGAWKNYDSAIPPTGPLANGVATRLADGTAGDIYVYCNGEADGPANLLKLDPISALATPSTFAWRYTAKYNFADLVDYSLYDYKEQSAPTASLTVTDGYLLEKDQLHVVASAQGTDSNGRAILLKLSGVLIKGTSEGPSRCRL
jgi:hypothetical protein